MSLANAFPTVLRDLPSVSRDASIGAPRCITPCRASRVPYPAHTGRGSKPPWTLPGTGREPRTLDACSGRGTRGHTATIAEAVQDSVMTKTLGTAGQGTIVLVRREAET